MSVEAEKWRQGFLALGHSVTRAAGHIDGAALPGDRIVVGLWADEPGGQPPAPDEGVMRELCSTHDLLVLDNAGTLGSAPEASVALERAAHAAGIPTIVRHHDPPWQTPTYSNTESTLFPLHSARMLHVTINDLTRAEFGRRWPELVPANALEVVHNHVPVMSPLINRSAARQTLKVTDTAVLLVHPARNVDRKNVAGGLRFAANLAESLHRDVQYWLTDPAGKIDSPEGVWVHRGFVDPQAALYAAADFILLPSIWEGWGLPVVEAAAAERLTVTYPYPVLSEIHALGIHTIDHRDIEGACKVLLDSAAYVALAERNRGAVSHLSVTHLPEVLSRLTSRAIALAR